MSVRAKTLLITTAAVGGLTIILYLAARLIVLGSFARLELHSLSQNVARAESSIQQEVQRVDTLCGDWAPWDDTYAFIQGANPGYIEQNLDESTIANLQLNLVAFVDASGKIAHSFGFDLGAHKKTAVPDGMLTHLAPDSPLLKHRDEESKHAGLLALPGGPMVVSARPILTSKREGPIRGTLIFGRWLDVEQLSSATRLSLSVEALPRGAALRQHLATPTTMFGCSRLRDVYSKPSFLLTVRMPRDIYRQGRQTLYYLLISLLALGVVSLAAGYLLVDRMVLLRLATLADSVRRIGASKQPGARVALAGRDELSALARAINDMLSALEQAEETIRHQAYHDALTDLPNRSFFYERLGQALARFPGDDTHLLAVLFLDLDGFKHVNDTLGHAVGDKLLQEVGLRLRACMREEDVVARLGGDEFSILLSRIRGPGDAATVAEKVLAALRVPFRIEGHELPARASVGISLYPKDGHTTDALLQNADIALYRAKDEGKNTFRFYAADINTRALARQALTTSLREALPRRELVLHYQPQVSAADGRVVGAEALLRWQHRDLGLLYPGQFLPLAEENDLMISFGAWVLKHACRECRGWQGAGADPVGVAVNLSGRQFWDPGLPGLVEAALAHSGLAAGLLTLELVQASVLGNLEFSHQILQRLKEAGVRIILEDVSMGGKLPEALAVLPVDGVKIDRFCLRKATTDTERAEEILAVIAEARARGMQVIAEGVETEDQLSCLRKHGCEVVQGYLLGRPVPPEEFRRLLGRRLAPVAPVASLS